MTASPSHYDPWWALSLDTVEYQEAWDLQRRLVQARQLGLVPDSLILLQHPHTYTLGRRAAIQHVLFDEATRLERGVSLHWVDRGGDITYHGPGQIVGYPIMDIRKRGLDVHRYLRTIEEALIRALAHFGIQGERDHAYTGVWVGKQKVAAIGVKISRGVTSHGFALNVDTDLSYFQGIVPCGITDRAVTSLTELLGGPQEIEAVRGVVAEEFFKTFGGSWEPVTLAAVLALTPPPPPAEPVGPPAASEPAPLRSVTIQAG